MSKMRRITVFAVLMAVSLVGAWAQETEPQDSTVEVIGWFCTNDTLEYSYSTVSAEVVAGDTTVTEYTDNEIRICVVDSTKRGYTMESVLTSVEISDSTSAQGRLRLQAARLGLGAKVMFTTDEYGVFKEISNVKDLYQQSLDLQQKIVDQIYEETPALYAKMSKPEMLKMMKDQLRKELDSKEAASNRFIQFKMLFLNHGKVFRLGEYEMESEEGNVSYIVTKGALEDEEDSNDNEYQIYYKVEMPEEDGVKTTNYYEYTYFDDGWPRSAMMTIVEEGADKTTLTQMKLVWLSKVW